jgi:hypothetical protein
MDYTSIISKFFIYFEEKLQIINHKARSSSFCLFYYIEVNISNNFANLCQYYVAGLMKELNTMYSNVKEDRDKICHIIIRIIAPINSYDPHFVTTNTCSLLLQLLLQ